MSINKKLWLMIVLALISVMAVLVLNLASERAAMIKGHETAVRHVVETAWGVISALDKRADAGEISKEDAQRFAIKQLKEIRYNEKEYFWINDMQPNMVMHPTKPEMDGKSLAENKDPTGKLLFIEMVKVVRESGGGFVHYMWPRPGSDQPIPKLSYVKGYQPWGWVVGSGIYIDDIDLEIKKEAIRAGLLALLVMAILSVFGHLLARSISRRIKQADNLADAVSQGHYENKIDADGSDEIASLLKSLHRMQTSLQTRQLTDQSVAREMSRLKCALDNVQTNVRVADNDGKLIYVNNALRDTLYRCEKEFQREIPSFVASKVVGGSVGIFYADPQAAVERLRKLTTSAHTKLLLGGRTYNVVTTPIITETGEKLGTVGQWIDLTEHLRTENEISQIVGAAANGDFTQRISLDAKEGFFLKLAQDINLLTQTCETGLSEVARLLEAMARADLTVNITSEYQGTFARLKEDSNSSVAKLVEIFSGIKQSTEMIYTAAEEISSGNNDLSRRTEEQASSLEETAASMEQLTSTVKQNAESAGQANQLTKSATQVAEKGGNVISQVVSTMQSISDSSRKIVDIISVIDGIAFQTNILALNAAVEAARAGEQGRGFAVVATEVRNLAQRSAAAAKEIKSLIGDSVEKVKGGSALVSEAGKTMEEIVTAVNRVSDIMAEITAASIEQSQGISQVNLAITQMDSVTQQNAALVEEAAAAAESMEKQAEELSEMVSIFRLPASEGEVLAPKKQVARISFKPALEQKFSFDDAILAHDKWKSRLVNYIKGTGTEELDVATVSRDDQCPLGGWIYGQASIHNTLPEYDELKVHHASFHSCVGEIVQCVHDQDLDQAKKMLGGEFFQNSKKTIASIKALQRQVEK
jgi:methyl-accepting chemotaxis protein